MQAKSKPLRVMEINAPSLEHAWQSYQEIYLLPDASERERAECRLAFWIGAAGLFRNMLRTFDMLDPDRVDAEVSTADEMRLRVLMHQVEQFEAEFAAEMARRERWMRH